MLMFLWLCNQCTNRYTYRPVAVGVLMTSKSAVDHLGGPKCILCVCVCIPVTMANFSVAVSCMHKVQTGDGRDSFVFQQSLLV